MIRTDSLFFGELLLNCSLLAETPELENHAMLTRINQGYEHSWYSFLEDLMIENPALRVTCS